MLSLALGLAVPLFCTFALSLPCQYNALTGLCDSEIVDTQQPDIDALLNGDSFNVAANLNPGQDTNSLLQIDDGSIFLAAKPHAQKPQQQGNQQLNQPGSSPGTRAPQTTPQRPQQQPQQQQQPQDSTQPETDTPWTLNPNSGLSKLPYELTVPAEYGYIGPYFSCNMNDGVRAEVDCKSGHQCARCNDHGTIYYYCDSPKYKDSGNAKCPSTQNSTPLKKASIDDPIDFSVEKRQLFADIYELPPLICTCGPLIP